MLKQRIMTAIILAALVFIGLFYLSNDGFRLALAAVLLIGAWEWARLAGWHSIGSQAAFIGIQAGLFALLQFYPSINFLYFSLLLWLGGLYAVFSYQQGRGLLFKPRFAKTLIGWLVLSATWLSLSLLHGLYGVTYLLCLLFLIWAADIGAYFTGRRFGRIKLAAKVSPGKSREGVYGGLFASLLVGLSFAIWQQLPLLSFGVLCLIVAAVSVLGDLIESLLKRDANMKDSSQLLPGHGGILDRLDSLLAASPWFLVGLSSIEALA